MGSAEESSKVMRPIWLKGNRNVGAREMKFVLGMQDNFLSLVNLNVR
jgi:hypothetical protein